MIEGWLRRVRHLIGWYLARPVLVGDLRCGHELVLRDGTVQVVEHISREQTSGIFQIHIVSLGGQHSQYLYRRGDQVLRLAPAIERRLCAR